jgi:hypothetical protein
MNFQRSRKGEEKTKTDPTKTFWTAYKKVADEYDKDLVSTYAGDLDTSLIFVSPFSSFVHSILLNHGLSLH